MKVIDMLIKVFTGKYILGMVTGAILTSFLYHYQLDRAHKDLLREKQDHIDTIRKEREYLDQIRERVKGL